MCADFEWNEENVNSFKMNTITALMERGSCRGKREYMSMREASDGATIMSNRIGEPLVAYQCPYCYLFHVGHRKGPKRLEAELALTQYQCDRRNRDQKQRNAL